jgi:hypothetical protein
MALAGEGVQWGTVIILEGGDGSAGAKLNLVVLWLGNRGGAAGQCSTADGLWRAGGWGGKLQIAGGRAVSVHGMKPGRGREQENSGERSKIVAAEDGNDCVYYRFGRMRRGWGREGRRGRRGMAGCPAGPGAAGKKSILFLRRGGSLGA